MQADPTSETPGAEERSGSDTDRAVFFWRPGCGFCIRLRRQLEDLEVPVVEVNIWEDRRGAEAVRAITGGDETVPTVVIGDVALVNPSGEQVLDVLRAGRDG